MIAKIYLFRDGIFRYNLEVQDFNKGKKKWLVQACRWKEKISTPLIHNDFRILYEDILVQYTASIRSNYNLHMGMIGRKESTFIYVRI